MSKAIWLVVWSALVSEVGTGRAESLEPPAPPASSPPAAAGIDGCWRASGYQPGLGRSDSWLMNRHQDGTFEITFTETGPRIAHHESGRWRFDGKIYATLTLVVDGKPVDARDPAYVDVYRLSDVTADAMSYVHVRTNTAYRSIRVPCAETSG